MTSRQLVYHPDARAEVDAAFDFYKDRSVGVAQAFYDEIVAAQIAINENPEMWAD